MLSSDSPLPLLGSTGEEVAPPSLSLSRLSWDDSVGGSGLSGAWICIEGGVEGPTRGTSERGGVVGGDGL